MSDWEPTASESENSSSISSASESETKYKKNKPAKCDDKTPKKRNFCESWVTRFKPWLIRNPDNPLVPFCKACSRVLLCRKHSIERHGRAAVHRRHFTAYCLANGLEAPDYGPIVKRPRKRTKRLKQIAPPAEDNEESLFETVFLEEEKDSERLKDSSNSRSNPQNRKKLLLQIQKDRSELMQLTAAISGEKKKSSLELFFDSLTTTVSSFPPKLAVETKLRVSQLICELEMCAITANENSAAAPLAPSTVLVSAPLDISYVFDYQEQGALNESNQVGSSQRDPTGKDAS